MKEIWLTDEQIDILLRLVDDEIEWTHKESEWLKKRPNIQIDPNLRWPLDELSEIRKNLTSV